MKKKVIPLMGQLSFITCGRAGAGRIGETHMVFRERREDESTPKKKRREGCGKLTANLPLVRRDIRIFQNLMGECRTLWGNQVDFRVTQAKSSY